MDTSKRLKALEDICKALKATYVVSGSMIAFHVLESQDYVDEVSIPSGRGAAIDWYLRFTPNETSAQARLTSLTMDFLMEITQADGTTLTASTGTKFADDISSSGQLVARADLSFPAGTFTKVKITAHGVASGLVGGTFSFDHNIILT